MPEASDSHLDKIKVLCSVTIDNSTVEITPGLVLVALQLES
ncbi:hypothetical protein [Planktothrix sp.]